MSMTRISTFVLGHKRLIVAAWVIVTLLSVVTAPRAVERLSQDFNVPGREGAETSQAILTTYGSGGQLPPIVPVVTLPEGTTVESIEVQEELGQLLADVQAVAPNSRVASWVSTGDPAFVSDDGRTTFALVFVPTGNGFAESADAIAAKEALAGATIAGAPVHITGYTELETGGSSGEEGSVLIETLVAAGAALVILFWVFGSLLAFVPLVIAGVSILSTFLVIYGVTFVVDVSFIVESIVALIGLGVAIDYALLIVTRWREERQAGLTNELAVQRAMESAGSAVVFSGTTVAIGLFALVVLPVPFLRSIGYGGMLIPLMSVLVALTLLPVALATIGPRIDWPRRRRGHAESRAWTAWSSMVVRRRWPATIVASVLLFALVIPAFNISIGDPRADALAQSGEPFEGLTALQESGIDAGVLLPFEVLVEGGDPDAVAAALGQVEGVRGTAAPDNERWRRGDSAVVAVFPADDGTSTGGQETLARVRDATNDLPGTVRVGGQAAQNADFIDAVYGNVWLMVTLVAIVTYVLLVRAFRSILLPLKALFLNIVSVAAAYGVMVLVWQEGFGAGLIWGYEATGSITSFIPIVVFAFLFGLSMDYEVFILARMREEYDRLGDNDAAIIRGLSATGRLVTSAALILFFAFASLAAAPVIPVKVLATGLAAGILIDATIVRAFLVPATVSLLGDWNWWLPARMARFVPATAHGASSTAVAPEPTQAH